MPHVNAALLLAPFALCALLGVGTGFSLADESTSGHRASSVRVVVLSTMLAEGSGDGTVATLIGEWGYSALVEVDGRKFLFDTGARPDTVLKNVRALGIDIPSGTGALPAPCPRRPVWSRTTSPRTWPW